MLRFVAFTVAVLGLPSAAFLAIAPRTAEDAGPAMLVFLLTPALVGWVLSRGVPTSRRADRAPLLATTALAGGVTLLIAAVGTLGAVLGGAMGTGGPVDPAGALGGAVSGALTSTVEELGWSIGGLALARAALGPRWGAIALGGVWAAWHLVVARFAPAPLVAGMFGRADPFTVGQLTGFVVGCVVYRVLLVRLRDRADSVWPAVVGHAAPNVLFGVLVGSGWAHFDPAASWVTFPGPTGLPFLAAAAVAAIALSERAARP